MGNNFLQIQIGKDASNRWRNVLSIGMLVFVVAGGWLWYFGMPTVFHQQAEGAPEATTPVEGDGSTLASAGGDITQPPPDAAPLLPLLEGTLIPAEDLSAASIIVKDKKSGVILYAKNEYAVRPIASITKLMSALVILEADPDWNQTAPVTSDQVAGTHMYAGETYTMESLWRAALVGSSNKAILSMVDALPWPREAFVERMNQKAVELGMTSTHFVEPTGLDSNDVSSAADIALLLEEALNVDRIRETLLLSEYNLVSVDKSVRRHIWSTNWLLLGWINNQFYDLRGGKTGYIPASGYNFTMQVADGRGETLDVVVLGADTHEARFTDARDVAMSVFESYAWPDEARVAGEKIEQK